MFGINNIQYAIHRLRAFFISNTSISNARLNLAKNRVYALKIIHILYLRYHPKIVGQILKISKRTSVPVLFKRQSHKMVKHTQTIRRQTAEGVLKVVFMRLYN